ncbi:MAG TPA: prolyl oligopeptidase family serine peptidase [Acidimicrobiales bacterium]|nr:prolyl oligopeptidase family serine peptidase [Acidimicrobiales bacterium]
MTTTAPFGSWRSPITADLLVENVVRLASVTVAGDDVFWVEGRPSEGGRQQLVRRRSDGSVVDVLPDGFGVRTLVHEYGGRACAVGPDGAVYFSNFTDQRLYRLAEGGEPEALTEEPSPPLSVRFADPVVSPDGAWIVCVRERHLGSSAVDVINDVVSLPSATAGAPPVVLAEGHDFYAAPRLSPDGASLCWLSWDHPNMPWDGTVLSVAPFADGRLAGAAEEVAGGPSESVSQPQWSPEGNLFFASDRTGWWNLYDRSGRPLCPIDAEFSGPDWVFGQSSFGFRGDGSIVTVVSERNLDRLAGLPAGGGTLAPIESELTGFSSLTVVGDDVVCIAGSPTQSTAVVRIPSDGRRHEVLRQSRRTTVDPGYVSVPEAIEFPTEGGSTAHAFFYAPRNSDFEGPSDERPPLIVMSHGGPTGATDSLLDIGLQYWTSRGFAVVDVNYGGSTGYGRAYRDRLRGSWGIVDVDDCVHAATWLASEGRVDGSRMVIRGGSAGGYTTLAALTFRDTFAAGASHFGVADAEALARDTHKFESRYLDGLIGPYPASRDLYIERSPIHHTDRLDRPMILFQGLEDKVVPPEQAEMMAEALRDKGIPFAYVSFAGEQHGFRAAETIKRVAEAELWFYGRVLGFGPGDEIEPVQLENEEALGARRAGGSR